MHARLNEGDASGDHTHYKNGVALERHSLSTMPKEHRRRRFSEGEDLTRTAIKGTVVLAVVPPLIKAATPAP